MSDFSPFREKMEAASVSEAAIRAFERNYQLLCLNESGLISEDSIRPCESLPLLEDVSVDGEAFDPELLKQTVVIKLNGGLGTSMGLQKAKSLLPVKDDTTFLDIIAQQILHLRETTGGKVRFLLMNSFSTSEDTLEHMEAYQENDLAGAESVEMMQNQIPKIDVNSMLPVDWEKNPSLEWCPPGHGDLYAALAGSGWLDALLAGGVKYAFVSNSDNLGAILDANLLRYFAESGKPFLMEATRRTEADKKGGHLAVRSSDEQLLLREVAQCPEEDLEQFQDVSKHQYFNTNSLWIRLDVLKELLEKENGVLPLPMIKNTKTVDPRDKQSTQVYQLETAMGAAIESFPGSGAICVPRSRFAPVKTTSDLFALRSDAYERTEDGRIALVAERDGKPPVIDLSDEYKLVDSLEGLGMPSLVQAGKLTVQGPVRFADGVTIVGNVSFINESGETKWVAGGKYTDEEVTL
ncbi:UTP--glucose-1-phosphate uridylyltransferase [Verrucomicrobiaceae bacterium N1E253]|uniref:UTP--glucose-1-phosphate uridylyltransferase n=1 Tax=Oceaniferula marina TaxID=2748318 RepID=A0A851G9K0_9BACT|nr:UTP--glucose-1-phosphate uridylyltransferase [Oceaniferula marina]NWK54388.1 UTP--glucose-1-phosphate uridylyltransferase [Oceaniferula marina]